ncbi:MAG: hypothetical protein AAF604_20475 [Acidobacteriota bacterium]
MPEASHRFEECRDLPDGSRFEIWVTGPDGAFRANAQILHGDHDHGDQRLRHERIYRPDGSDRQGAVELEAPCNFIAEVRFRFEQDATAVLHTQTILPGGARRCEYTWTIEGSAGDRFLRGMFLFTEDEV